MMRGIFKKTALSLLPLLVHAFVLPGDTSDEWSRLDISSSTLESLPYGGPSTFFEYDIDDHSIKFAIPCPNCSDEEKDLLRQAIISVKPTLQNTEHCTSSDPIGLEIDGNPILSTGESSLTLQSHIGPLDLADHLKHHIFNRIRWINHCGCTEEHQNGGQCDGHFESSFSFEVLGLASGEIPGFTLTYRQYGAPELLRLSTFPDIGIADAWRFGQSAHYRSPLLRVQKAVRPSLTLASLPPSSSSLGSPTLTSSASLPSYTYLEHLEDPTTKRNSEAGHSEQSRFLDVEAPRPTGLEHCDPNHHRRCHLSNALVDLGHGLEVVGMKAKSGAQAFLGKLQFTSAILQKQQTSQTSPLTPVVATLSDHLDAGTEDDSNDVGVAAHDELESVDANPHDELGHDDTQQQLDRLEDFLMLDLPSTSWKLDSSATVKAFQVTSLVFIVVALFGSLTTLAFRNPRIRAQWATIVEERRNRRLYRQAACKQRVQTFFGRFKMSSAVEKAGTSLQYSDTTLDWQGWEKRVSLEGARRDHHNGNNDLSHDLLAFRKAHQFVDGIISAETGRSSSSRQMRRERFVSRARHQRTWSLGSEKTAPPAYESEGEDLVLDADGPRYVVLGRGFTKSDTSPDSSVISTSPRTSCVDSDSESDDKF